MLGLFIPEDMAVSARLPLNSAIAVEELSRACVGVSTSYAAQCNSDTFPSNSCFGTRDQKKNTFPPHEIAAGQEARLPSALRKPNAGSDAGGIQTTARLDGDYYVLRWDQAVDHQWERCRCLHDNRYNR